METNMKTHRPKQGLKNITFHWHNAPSRTAKVTIVKISELEMNQMLHSQYSPDIAPSDFFFQAFEKQAPRMLLRLSR
jgi:hypothetical protein